MIVGGHGSPLKTSHRSSSHRCEEAATEGCFPFYEKQGLDPKALLLSQVGWPVGLSTGKEGDTQGFSSDSLSVLSTIFLEKKDFS